MKKIFYLFLILLFQYSFSYPLKADSTIKVGIYNNEPLIFIDKDGNGKGIFADVMEYIASKEGWKIEYAGGTFQQCLSRLESNQIDILSTIAFSIDRDKHYDFNKENLLTNWGQLYTVKNSEIKSIMDLAEKKIAVLKGDIHHAVFNQITKEFGIQCKIIATDDYHSVLKMVSRHEADAGVVNRFFGMKYGEKYNVDKNGVIFNPIKIHYAVLEGKNQSIIAAMDRHIKLLKNNDSSVYYRSLEKWLGAVSGKWIFPQWGKWAIAGTLGIIIFLFFGSLVLKNRVRTGIRELTIELNRRRQAEKDLRESVEKYRSILKNIDDGYFEVDITGCLTFFNDSLCRILGYSRKQLMGIHSREFMDEENSKKIYLAFNKVYRTGESTKALDWKLIRKDRSICFAEIIVSLMTDSDDKRIGFRGIARDITDRKLLEGHLRQAQKMESIGTLTGGIAHDFNNILFMIIGNVELALEDIPESNPVYTNLEKIKAAGLRAAGIVKQLLNFSRKTDQDLKPIDIIAVIKDALKFLDSTIPSTIKIQKNIADREITILADPIQINQVLMNICINASQAMEETGGVLKINVEKESVTVNSAHSYPGMAEGDYIKIMVSDAGPGIESQFIDRIFDPYFTTKAIGKGSGMGLAVVQGIVKTHNGTITVKSRPGKGATFTILFPVVDKKPVAHSETTDEIPPVGSETILFVDDEESIVDVTGQILKALGYKVETQTNPQDALKIFQSKPHDFDLVITDMTMPRMTGIQLSEKLMGIRSDIPVIICTGRSSHIDEEKAGQIGIADYIMKPISMLEIAKIIRKVLDKKISGK